MDARDVWRWLGALLLVAAVLATSTAHWSIVQHRRHATALRTQADSLAAARAGATDAGSVAALNYLLARTAHHLAEAEFHVRANRRLRTDLWRWNGLSLIMAVGGLAALGGGFVPARRDAPSAP